MTKDETLKLALEALENLFGIPDKWTGEGGGDVAVWRLGGSYRAQEAIKAIKAALEAKDEPVAWEGGEDWESLAWQLCADECGEEACTELIWEGGPIPEPWGDRWMKYEYEAKRLIALVRKHTTPPQRTWVGLTDEEVKQLCLAVGTEPMEVRLIEAKLKEKNT